MRSEIIINFSPEAACIYWLLSRLPSGRRWNVRSCFHSFAVVRTIAYLGVSPCTFSPFSANLYVWLKKATPRSWRSSLVWIRFSRQWNQCGEAWVSLLPNFMGWCYRPRRWRLLCEYGSDCFPRFQCASGLFFWPRRAEEGGSVDPVEIIQECGNIPVRLSSWTSMLFCH